MQPFIDYRAAVDAFNDASDAAAKAPRGARPSRAYVDQSARAANAAGDQLRDWIPDTAEGAAAKLACAAIDIEGGTFEDAETLAEEANTLAGILASGEQCPALAGRLRRLLVACERSLVMFRLLHPGHPCVDGADVLGHIRTALAGLTRPRAAT